MALISQLNGYHMALISQLNGYHMALISQVNGDTDIPNTRSCVIYKRPGRWVLPPVDKLWDYSCLPAICEVRSNN